MYIRVGEDEYVYSLEKAHHDEFFRLYRHTPGKALNFIKKHAFWCEKML